MTDLTPNSPPRKARAQRKRHWGRRIGILVLILAGLLACTLYAANMWLQQQAQPVLAQFGWPQARLWLSPRLTGLTLNVYPDAETETALLKADFSPLALLRNLKEGNTIGTISLQEGALQWGDKSIPFGPVALAVNPAEDGGNYLVTGQGALAGNNFTLDSRLNQAGNGQVNVKFTLTETAALMGLLPLETMSSLKDVTAKGEGDVKWVLKEWQPDHLEPEGRLKLTQAALTYNDLLLEGIKGEFDLGHSKEGQWQLNSVNDLTVQRISAAVPLENVKANVNINSSRINVKSARANVLGGYATIKPTTIALPLSSIKAEVVANELDLATILAMGKLDGLSGNGKLSGNIPFTYQKGDLVFHDAHLSTGEPGQVAYAPTEPPSFMAEGGQAAIIGQVFNDFRYKNLTVRISGTLGKDLAMTTRLEGANPNFYSGHPVAFNLNLTGALDSVLRQGMATSNLTAGGLSDMMKMEGTPQ